MHEQARARLLDCQIASNRDPLSRPILTPLARDGILLGQGNATTRMRMRRRCRSGVRHCLIEATTATPH